MVYKPLGKYAKEKWNEIYKKEKPPKNIQENFARIVDLFKNCNVKRVLDLACGCGRHTFYLAENGFETYGLDISEEAIKFTRNILQKKGLYANLIVSSIYEELPYKDNFFDAIVCIQSLHHARVTTIRRAIKEMERVLKSNSFIFVTVRKRISKKQRLPFKEAGSRTYIPLEGKEKGLVHYLYNKKLILKDFRNFKIQDIWVDSKNYYCFLGELENLLNTYEKEFFYPSSL